MRLVRFYEGVDGLKTGYAKEAGYCLTATIEKNDMRIIAVVMGEPDSKMRSKEISEMLDYSYAQYKVENLLKNKSSIGKYEVDKGKENSKVIRTVNLTIAKSVKKANIFELYIRNLKDMFTGEINI